MTTATASAVAVRNPWALVPSMGDLNAYISAVNRIPMLEPQEERDLATRLRDHSDLEAAGRMVLSHLRLVVSVSRQYAGYGVPQADLIQEGNIGLMKAVRRFDPDQGVRLVSYALHWIKADIHEFVLKNWRMVKLATSKPQRKLFFNLRAMKHKMHAEGRARSLTMAEADQIAAKLNVKREEVLEMEVRLSGSDVPLESRDDGEDEDRFAPIHHLRDDTQEPTQRLEARAQDGMASQGIALALDGLDARSRRIVEERWLNVNDDGGGGMKLHELAEEYGVSTERIRQIEAVALKKMRKLLDPGADSAAPPAKPTSKRLVLEADTAQ